MKVKVIITLRIQIVTGVLRPRLICKFDWLFISCVYILCKINLAIFDVTYNFDHLRAILDISLI